MHYRDYLGEDGEVIEERRPEYDLFAYVVGRFFPSVNPTVNVYNKVIRKTVDVSKVFSPSDEAWVLLTMDNYRDRWLRMLENPESKDATENTVVDGKVTVWRKGAHRLDPFFQAKYTSSQHGKKVSGWSDEGIQQFNWYVGEVKKLRALPLSGQLLEATLRDRWVGPRSEMEVDEVRAMRDHVVEEAYTDLDLFGV